MQSLRKRRSAFLLLQALCALPLLAAGAEVQIGNTQSVEDPAKIRYLETHGVLEPNRRYVQRLKPGQELVRMSLKPDARVHKGEVLAVLTDDALNTQVLTLEERRLAHLGEVQQRDLLRLEIGEADEGLRRAKDELKEERRLEKQLPEYSDGLRVRELETSLREKETALRTKKRKLELLNQRIAEATPVQREVDARLSQLRQRVSALTVEAPFAGRVVNVAPYPQNALSGDVLFELWDDQSYRVVVDLLQNQVGYVQPGDTAEVISDFDESLKLRGTVRSILPARSTNEPGSYPRFPAVIDLEAGKPTPLVVGMSVAVRIRIDKRQ